MGIEYDRESCSVAITRTNLKGAPELFDKYAHEFQTEGFAILHFEPLGQTDAVIGHGQYEPITRVRMKIDADLTRPAGLPP